MVEVGELYNLIKYNIRGYLIRKTILIVIANPGIFIV